MSVTLVWGHQTVKVHAGGHKVHAWQTVRRCMGTCSALLCVLSSCRQSESCADCTAQRTALPMRGGMRRKLRGPCWGTAWLLSDYSVSGQQAEPSGARRTAIRTHMLISSGSASFICFVGMASPGVICAALHNAVNFPRRACIP